MSLFDHSHRGRSWTMDVYRTILAAAPALNYPRYASAAYPKGIDSA
jgi:hypothetical protein